MKTYVLTLLPLGLTDEEIRSAIERSGVKEPSPLPSAQGGQQLVQHAGPTGGNKIIQNKANQST